MTHDVATLLHTRHRRQFDPSSKKDLQELFYFRKNAKWKNGCPFLLEWPHSDIVTMCINVFTNHALKKLK